MKKIKIRKPRWVTLALARWLDRHYISEVFDQLYKLEQRFDLMIESVVCLQDQITELKQ